jgi:regulatory protein
VADNPKTNTSDNRNILLGGYPKALNTALRILTGRDHSKSELIRKLKQRGFSPEDIAKAVSECERLDYINDERTAGVYINQMIRKGHGLNRIRHEMNKKGLTGQRIQNILDQIESDIDEAQGAERILEKNIKRFEREKDLKKRRDKIYRFLYARGFSQDTIRKLINNYESAL